MSRRCYFCRKTKTLHKFPEDRQILQIWSQICDMEIRDGDDLSRIFVCSDHFEEKYFEKGGLRRKLKKGAIPTINVSNKEPKYALSTVYVPDSITDNFEVENHEIEIKETEYNIIEPKQEIPDNAFEHIHMEVHEDYPRIQPVNKKPRYIGDVVESDLNNLEYAKFTLSMCKRIIIKKEYTIKTLLVKYQNLKKTIDSLKKSVNFCTKHHKKLEHILIKRGHKNIQKLCRKYEENAQINEFEAEQQDMEEQPENTVDLKKIEENKDILDDYTVEQINDPVINKDAIDNSEFDFAESDLSVTGYATMAFTTAKQIIAKKELMLRALQVRNRTMNRTIQGLRKTLEYCTKNHILLEKFLVKRKLQNRLQKKIKEKELNSKTQESPIEEEDMGDLENIVVPEQNKNKINENIIDLTEDVNNGEQVEVENFRPACFAENPPRCLNSIREIDLDNSVNARIAFSMAKQRITMKDKLIKSLQTENAKLRRHVSGDAEVKDDVGSSFFTNARIYNVHEDYPRDPITKKPLYIGEVVENDKTIPEYAKFAFSMLTETMAKKNDTIKSLQKKNSSMLKTIDRLKKTIAYCTNKHMKIESYLLKRKAAEYNKRHKIAEEISQNIKSEEIKSEEIEVGEIKMEEVDFEDSENS